MGSYFVGPEKTYENMEGNFVLLPINPKRRPTFCHCAIAIRKLEKVLDEELWRPRGTHNKQLKTITAPLR